MPMRLRALAEQLGATVHGDGDPEITGVAPIDRAGPDEITFVANQRYVRHLADTKAAAVLVGPRTEAPDHVQRIVCDDPYYAFRNALIILAGFRVHPEPIGALPTAEDAADAPQISDQAAVHPSAEIGPGCRIHPFASVQAGAKLGSGCVLYPGSTVGVDATLGDDVVLYPNAVVYDRCILGDRVAIHANSVIGQDGFGYATHQGVHHKIPQTGIVVVEDDVEVGAGNAIERAAMGETRIGAGTKMADLISIGHGTTVGRGCLFVSLVGISGSVRVGNYVVLGGQVGTAGHLSIGDGVQVGAKAGIHSDVPAGAKIAGVPAVELKTARRNMVAASQLGELVQRVRELERRVTAALQDGSSGGSSEGAADGTTPDA